LETHDNTQRDPDLNSVPSADELNGDLDTPVADSPQTLGTWIRNHGPMLMFLAAVLVFLVWKFDIAGLLTIAKVAIGLGFIVFIHELGHFLVAKWCDVHVTTFSIGFGPALPFCSWTWGETTYKLAVFPLGGYVQMVGQVDGDESSDGSEDDPRSYRNKSVWQRMAIISAGVIMNAIFACVAFTVVFLGPGKPRQAATIAAVNSSQPAFTEGVRTGSEILRVNDIDHPYFEDLKFETIASLDKISIVTQRRFGVDPRGGDTDAKPVTLDITPHQASVRMIGIYPTQQLQLAPRKALSQFASPAIPGSAAAQASPAFEFDDLIVGTTDADDPSKGVTLLRNDPRRDDGSNLKDYFEFQRRLSVLAGKAIVIRVERGPEGHKQTVDIHVPATFHRTFGVRMKMGQIVAVRKGSQATGPGGVVARPEDSVDGGDIIQEVTVREPGGNEVHWKEGDNLDPVRLPYQLKQWAARVWQARGWQPSDKDREVTLIVRRQNKHNGAETKTETVKLLWDHGWRDDRILPMLANSPEPIAELGLAYLVKNEVDGPEERAAAAQVAGTGVAGGAAARQADEQSALQKNDEIIDIAFVTLKPDGSKDEGNWQSKALKGAEWAYYDSLLQAPAIAKVKLKIKRAGKEQEIELTPVADQTWPQDERGFILTPDTRIERATGVLQAIEMGFRDTHRSMTQVYLHLRGLVAGTISIDNLGGPVAITTTAYKVAQYDFWEFVFFLGLISVNLAVLNFLPIPVLDGGHMVFLIYEKLRGKPASEGVRIGATYAGLLLIGCLMIFVLVLDIRRLVGG
jgi:regulator of sigma E protease